MKNRRIDIRKRIITAALICSGLFFFLTSPIIDLVTNIITQPLEVSKLTVLREDKLLRSTWEPAYEDGVVKEYFLITGGKTFTLKPSETFLDLSIEELDFSNGNYDFSFYYFDYLNRKSEPINLNLQNLITSSSNEVLIYESPNRAVALTSRSDYVLFCSILIATFATALLAWIFLFKFDNKKSLILLGYLFFVVLSFLNLGLTFLFSQDLGLGRLLLALITTPIFYVFIYLFYLTLNILQNSFYYDLPLEQAAKASQFIFSLLASYVSVFYILGATQNFLFRIIIITFLTFIFTFGSVASHKLIDLKEALLKTISICVTIAFSLIVLSFWGINYLYLVLAIAVIYYILLSIALETRSTLPKYAYIEYPILVILILFLLFVSSNWGIRGTLL